MTVEERLDEFRRFLRREEVKESSIYQYTSAVREFLNFAADRIPDAGLVTEFLDRLKERSKLRGEGKLKLRGGQFKKIVLRRYLESAGRRDLASLVKVKKVPTSLSRYLTEGQVEAMIQKADNARDRAMVEVLFASCPRREETCNLRVEDILRDRMRLRVVGKGRGEGKVRYPPISPRALEALDAYLREAGITQGRIFNLSPAQVYRVVERLGEKAAIPFPVHPHLLRHSGAKHLRRKGMPLEVLKEILGHESYDTTLIYGGVEDEELDKYYHGESRQAQ